MKTLFHSHGLDTTHSSVVLSQHNFNAPNPVLPDMLTALKPDIEIFTSVDHAEEKDPFMHKNIIFETIKHFKNVDGYVTDQIFIDNYHHIDSLFVNEMSKLIGDKHFIIGPSFAKIPYFRQSQILDELIEYDVSGVMYDLRDINFNEFHELQPLAKLKIHAKKRVQILPVVNDIEERDELLKNIPFEMCCIHNKEGK